MKYRKVLLLNQYYAPLDVVSSRKADDLIRWRCKAHILHEYAEKNGIYDAAVIRLLVKSPDPFTIFEKQKFSKRNVFLRDRYLCQYCSKRLQGKDLTIDHVIPRAANGETCYANCVTACKKCNTTKADRTPEQAGMKLISPIRKPTIYDIFNVGRIPDEWTDYLKFE